VADDGNPGRRGRWTRALHIPAAATREADLRVGAALTSLLDPAGRAEVDALVARGEPIRAIKRVRELTSVRLLDAKRLVESLPR
jgi:ribosomal protein L7/L12